MQNGLVESFNGRLRDECLNKHLSADLKEARQIIEEWRIQPLLTWAWRRGRDSNPRYPCEYAAFRVRCFQPLSHLSGA